ncbi:ABC transporter substrate-binding protein [Pararhizobium mangrovi]|uniref:ABC transporter substrate-binding protein n=1 Tax=Pararhizobium mangrovi TaxID=2590452 RepID=A0A506U4N3_9HYPH|nr:ABC transporter substrate-binding protein [Pararhizobium mangrovi]
MAVLGLSTALAIAGPARAADAPDPANWQAVLDSAKGETVYWNAWGGSQNVNDYIDWAGRQVKARYGVTIREVKVDDTANAVAKVVAEKAAGKNESGSVDLVWINGENFVDMKDKGLLMSPGWATKLPNWKYVAFKQNPTITTDFNTPTDGLESPWGNAKLVFFYDSARTDAKDLPKDTDGLLRWAKAHPGRFSYPAPPDFIGSSFLKQVLYEHIGDTSKLYKPVNDATFEQDVKPLFTYLDALKPYLWRKGADYPENYPDMKRKLADGELGIIFAFNPSEASSAIENGELPDTVRSFTFPGGTLGNTHFVAIPYNANAKAGALVVANFLISPEAQLHKQDPQYWGDPTVLAMDKLSEKERRKFADLDLGAATLPPSELGPVIPEPDASWTTRIEAAWKKRYGTAR